MNKKLFNWFLVVLFTVGTGYDLYMLFTRTNYMDIVWCIFDILFACFFINGATRVDAR
jgi:hypothetical protein